MDYWDIEILASRMGILPSQLMSGKTPKPPGISYTESVKRRQAKYNRTEKGKARLKRYEESEKGKENQKRKYIRDIVSGRNAERCRRYRERKKAEKDIQRAMQDL